MSDDKDTKPAAKKAAEPKKNKDGHVPGAELSHDDLLKMRQSKPTFDIDEE